MTRTALIIILFTRAVKRTEPLAAQRRRRAEFEQLKLSPVSWRREAGGASPVSWWRGWSQVWRKQGR